MSRSPVRKRVNVTLTQETIRLLDRIAPKGERSLVINEAVRHYVTERGRAALRARIRKGAEVNAERDLRIAEEWFGFEDEWPDDDD